MYSVLQTVGYMFQKIREIMLNCPVLGLNLWIISIGLAAVAVVFEILRFAIHGKGGD